MAPNLNVQLVTAHRSKGREADYVVIADVNKERYGFPCEITDDPVLELVLAHADAYEYAEERRLFYVAMTRARNDVYLLAKDGMSSDFLFELSERSYGIDFMDTPAQLKRAQCPNCEVGRLEVFERRYGHFSECRLCGHKPSKAARSHRVS